MNVAFQGNVESFLCENRATCEFPLTLASRRVALRLRFVSAVCERGLRDGSCVAITETREGQQIPGVPTSDNSVASIV